MLPQKAEIGGRRDRAPVDEAARVVAAECDGLPLAICLAGAMARAGMSWADLGEALRSADLSFVSARLPADLYPHTSLLRALQVSVDALRASSDPEQRIAAERYFDLGPLRWDEGVPEATVVTVWRARGGLRPQDARKLVSVLASKALLRTEGVSPVRTLRLHDLLHDFIRGSVDDLAAEHGAYVDAVAAVVPEAPFVSDDFYYLDHLAYHLAEARRVDELHELLACETANGAHAWWETRLAHGQVSGFVDDVRRASAAATHSVALTARYALVMGSVRSAVGEVWAELAELFVEHEMWTPAQVLAAADWAEGAHSRFALLLVALRRLEAPEREAVVSEAAVMARQEPEDQDRARKLIELAGALGDEGNEYLEEALQVVAVAGVRGSAYLYADAFAARPSRTDLFDAALRLLEPEHDDLTLRTAVEQLAPRAPISRLERLARFAATVGSPNERAHALLAVSEREDFEGRAEAVAGARDATELVNEPRREARLLARLARFLPDDQGRAVAGRALAVVDALNARDSFGVALDVLPFVEGDQRVHAERIALTVERLSPQDLAEVLANESRVRTLREREPELYRLLVDSAVRAVAANPDARRRGLTLRRVLALAPTETAVSALRDEARRILLIDDAEYASRCLADVASQLDRLQSADAVGARIDRLLARLEPNEVVRPVTPLLALADVARLRAVESAAAEADTRFDLDFRPALAAAWAQLGDWDRALSALDGASPFELAKAIELFGELPEAVARALLQWAIEARDPELFAGVVAAAADLPEPERSGCARLAIEAAAALDNPSTRCSLIKRALASAPCELVGELGALLLDDDVGLEQEQALAELTRAHIRCGDAAGVVAATRRLGYIETILPLQLEAQQTFGLDGEAEFLDRAESDARALRGPSRVELLVEIAKHSPERRERLLREATLHARDPASFEGWPGQRAQAESLALVAGLHVGEEHTNLLLEAWRLAPAAGSSEGVDVLRELGPSLASLAPDVLLEPWREGLAAASRSRRAVFEELGALAPVAAALGGHDEMQRIVTALDDVDRWWPSLPNVF